MAMICDICGKHGSMGRQHTHKPGVAGGQWKKRAPHTSRHFAPNLHFVTLPINGVLTRVKACASCIKRMRFDLQKAQTKPSIVASV